MYKGLYFLIFLSSGFLLGFILHPDQDFAFPRMAFLSSQGISQSPNHPPVVKILQPSENNKYPWNSTVPYSVEISDPEDGESKYQEIPAAEVLVKLKYAATRMKAIGYLKQKKYNDTAGVMNMLLSNCFSCHSIKMKMAGPSFYDISVKYLNTSSDRDLLVSHIKKGSTGIWSKESMPSHPELTDSVIRKMVKWIMSYAKDPELNYVVGLQGALPLHKPANTTGSGVFIMSVFYTDHGSIASPEKRIIGSDHLIIQMK